ncbi:MAG: amidase [Acidobacteriia bacterium]|nr:amidase [Terriglobia bacterium]
MAERIRRREISPVELVDAHLQRATALQPKLNAFVHLAQEEARAQARRAEAAVLCGEPLGPLHGVPITVKSCIDVGGWRCPAGSALRKDYVPVQDAVGVARLKAGGAILIGNTNTPEFLLAYETNNSVQGKTSNPWDLSRSAGGSSGGEAAAIASGCSAGGIGSDGGGSVRVPAHFCGICGLKPTPGRIAATGHFPDGAGAFPWLGVVGPMARTVGDLRLLLEAIAGPDAGDSCSVAAPLQRAEDATRRGGRVGILESDALGAVSAETSAAVEHAARALEDQGMAVEPVRLAGLDRAIALWWYFFGSVIGHLVRGSVAGQEAELSPMLREYLEVAAGEPAVTIDAFLAACTERDNVRAEILRQMEDFPVLLAPVSSGPAFRHGEGTWRTGAGAPYRETMRHSQWLNLAGLPGVAVPAGASAEGLPIGVQVIGRPFEEERILGVAECIERAVGGPRRPPEF